MGWANLVDRVTEAAQTGASFGKGFAVGVTDGVISLATGLKDVAVGGYNLATDPAAQERARRAAAAAADYGGQFIKDPATRSKAYEQVQQVVGHARDEFVAARDQAAREGKLSEFYGKIAGRAGFEVGTIVVPVAKLGAVTRVAEAGEAVADVSKVARGGAILADAKAGQVAIECSRVGAPSASRVGNVEAGAVAGRTSLNLRYPVATNPNEAFFWSGRTDGVGGEAVARQIAAKQSGTTLEALIENRDIQMPKWDPTNPNVVQAWKDISADYAKGASGTVRAVIGRSLRSGNVWEASELPALKANPNVTQIITIDPATRVETTIYMR